VLAVLPTLQNMATTLHKTECIRLNKDVEHTTVIVNVTDDSIRCVRIDGGIVPIIHIAGAWMLENVFNGTSDNIVDAIRRGIIIAHKRLRWTLGKNKPRIAAEYVERVKAYRAIAGKSFTLPANNFKTVVSLSMSDAMTGEVVTRDNVRPTDVERTQREMALELTALVYSHTQVAEVLDLLEAQKLAASEPSVVNSVALTVASTDYAIQSLTYDGYAEGVSHTSTVDIDAFAQSKAESVAKFLEDSRK